MEFNYFRRTLADPTQRAVTAATVTVTSAGLVTLVWLLLASTPDTVAISSNDTPTGG